MCVCACMHACMYVCAHACTYVYLYVCISVQVCVCNMQGEIEFYIDYRAVTLLLSAKQF